MNEKLKNQIAEELEISPSDLVSDKLLTEIETWDSVTALIIMIMIGDEVGIPVAPNEMKALKNFGDIERLVLKKRKFLKEHGEELAETINY